MRTEEKSRKSIQNRVLQCQVGFVIFCIGSIIADLILTLFYDDPNSHSYGLGENRGITISHTMTGTYSKPVALVLIFTANLHFISISHYQWAIFDIIANEMYHTATIGEKIYSSMIRTNNVAYFIGALGAFSLQCIVIFDVVRFLTAHTVFAIMFFISCMLYAALMSANEGILRQNGVIGRINSFGLVLVIGLAIFFCGLIFTAMYAVVASDIEVTKILKAAFEYAFMLTASLLIASRNYVRAPLFNQFNFDPLVHCRLFSISHIFYDLLRRPLPRGDKVESNEETPEAMSENPPVT